MNARHGRAPTSGPAPAEIEGDRPQGVRSTSPLRIIHLKEVKHLTSLSTPTIYERMKARTFPRSIGLGGRRVGWLLSDIEAWIQARVNESAAATTSDPGRQ